MRGGFLPGREYNMDKQRQEQIIIALKEKGATQPCPRCRNLEFEVIGESMVEISQEGRRRIVDTPMLEIPAVPVILVSCTNCGYIAHHATRLLDLKR
jgi:predicted nucleic-acid-binding Zn-ribbon protein